jgi:hypothetical protein
MNDLFEPGVCSGMPRNLDMIETRRLPPASIVLIKILKLIK